MHHYKGQLRREQDYTPTKSSWDRDHPPPSKYEPRNEREVRYEPAKFDTRYEKSQISYYQSQESKGSRVYYENDRSERPSVRSQGGMIEGYLFNEVMPVRLKSLEREEYETGLRVQVQSRSDKGQSILSIQLTDDSNPKFLWTFAIREADFMTLKNEQKLKVSYSGFPEMLQNCLRECLPREYTGESRNNHLCLEIVKGEGTLNLVESNRYKQSIHLSLRFKLANDEQVKDHLSNKLLAASNELESNRNTISRLQNVLSQRKHEIEIKDMELKQLLNEKEQLVDQLKLDEKRKLNELQSRSLGELSKTKRQFQLQNKELRNKFQNEVDSLTKSKSELTQKLTEARERIATLDANEREQKITITRLQKEMQKYLKEADQLKSQNKELSERRFQNEKTMTELSCKIDSLRSQLEDKKTIITSTVQLKQTNNSQISALEQTNTDQKKQIMKLQSKISELEIELSRLGNNNTELQDKILRQKEKLQERTQIIKEQEQDIKELKRTESTLNRENEDLRIRNSEKDARIKSIQQQLELCQKKLAEESSMVAYLQKGLNERSLRPGGSYQPTTFNSSYREMPSQLSNNSNVSTSRVALTGNTTGGGKYEPTIKRYEERSRSPALTRLPQQKDPEEEEAEKREKVEVRERGGFQVPRPVKFKMSQGARQSQK